MGASFPSTQIGKEAAQVCRKTDAKEYLERSALDGVRKVYGAGIQVVSYSRIRHGHRGGNSRFYKVLLSASFHVIFSIRRQPRLVALYVEGRR